jgi:hypothetical protein
MHTARLKDFAVVQMNLKRWLDAPKKYGRSSLGLSRASVPRLHIEASLADQFADLALTAIRLDGRPRRKASISGEKQALAMPRTRPEELHVLRVRLPAQRPMLRVVLPDLIALLQSACGLDIGKRDGGGEGHV